MDTARQGCQKGRATQVTGRLSLHFSRLLEPEAVEPLAASRHHDTHTLTRLPPRLLHLLHHLCPSACVPCWWPCRISALAYACKRALARVRACVQQSTCTCNGIHVHRERGQEAVRETDGEGGGKGGEGGRRGQGGGKDWRRPRTEARPSNSTYKADI